MKMITIAAALTLTAAPAFAATQISARSEARARSTAVANRYDLGAPNAGPNGSGQQGDPADSL